MIIRQLKSLLVFGGVLLLSLLGLNVIGSLVVEADFNSPAALIAAVTAVSPARVMRALPGDTGTRSTLSGAGGWPGYATLFPLSRPLVMTSYVYLPVVIRSPELDFAGRVIEQTNVYRALHGCPPLKLSQPLAEAALRHSTDMALHDFVSHTGSDGSSFVSRSKDAGYLNWSHLAENVGAGYANPEEVVDAWMASGGGHRENILNCEFEDTGVGYYYLADDTGSANYHTYWTQVFGATW